MLLPPTSGTLKKYGLSLEAWQRMADAQQHACAVCKQEPKKGRLCIDHEHVKKWKHMPPEERVLAVRGLLCFRCNTTFVGRGITLERSRGVTAFLEAYQARQAARTAVSIRLETLKERVSGLVAVIV